MRFENLSLKTRRIHSCVIKIQFKYLSRRNHLQDCIPKARKSPGRAVKISIHRECTYSATLSRLKAPSRRKGLKSVIYPFVSAARVWNGSDYFRVGTHTPANAPRAGFSFRRRVWRKKKQKEIRRKVNKNVRNTSRQPQKGVSLPEAICRKERRPAERDPRLWSWPVHPSASHVEDIIARRLVSSPEQLSHDNINTPDRVRSSDEDPPRSFTFKLFF